MSTQSTSSLPVAGSGSKVVPRSRVQLPIDPAAPAEAYSIVTNVDLAVGPDATGVDHDSVDRASHAEPGQLHGLVVGQPDQLDSARHQDGEPARRPR